jgi:hypothetical protein
MPRLHHWFSKKYRWYAYWHSQPAHFFVHWTVFILVAALFSASLTNSILASGQTAELALASVPFHAKSPVKAGQAIQPAQDRILIKFKNTVSRAKQAQILAAYSLKELKEVPRLGVKTLLVSANDTPEEMVQRLRANEKTSLDFAEPVVK